MWMIAAYFRQTHSPSWLAWSEGWWPPVAQSTFIRWTGWTLAMTLVMMTAPQTLSWLLLLLLLLYCSLLHACTWLVPDLLVTNVFETNAYSTFECVRWKFAICWLTCTFTQLKISMYEDSVDNTVEDNSSIFCLIQMHIVSKGMRAVRVCIKKIVQFLTGSCRLTQVELCNGHKMVGWLRGWKFVTDLYWLYHCSCVWVCARGACMQLIRWSFVTVVLRRNDWRDQFAAVWSPAVVIIFHIPELSGLLSSSVLRLLNTASGQASSKVFNKC